MNQATLARELPAKPGRATIMPLFMAALGMPRSKTIGAAFVVSPDGYLVTLAHLMATAERMAARVAPRPTQCIAGRLGPVEVVDTDPDNDLALVRLHNAFATIEPPRPLANLQRLTLAPQLPAVGDTLTISGYSLGSRELGTLAGPVLTPWYTVATEHAPRLSGPVIGVLTEHGHCGSPVTRPDGAVVGVVVACEPDQNLTLAVPAAAVVALCQRHGVTPIIAES